MTRRGKPVVYLVRAGTTDAKAKRVRVAEAFRRLGAPRKQMRLDGGLKAIAREGLD